MRAESAFDEITLICPDQRIHVRYKALLTWNSAKHTRMRYNARTIIKTINTDEALGRTGLTGCAEPVWLVQAGLWVDIEQWARETPVGARRTRVDLRSVRPLKTPSNAAGMLEE